MSDPFDQTSFELSSLWNGVTAVATSHLIQVYYWQGHPWHDEFRGLFGYRNDGELAGGTVMSWVAKFGSEMLVSMDGISIPALDIVAAASTSSTKDDYAVISRALTGDDKLSGNRSNDILLGYSGRDTLAGGSGKDQLDGGSGSDKLVGGLGRDFLTGGSGADVFDFNRTSESSTVSGFDRINDFQRGQDRIDLSTIDADPDTAGNQAFVFIGRQKFSGVDGELRITGGVVYGDTDGDKVADFAIEVPALSSMDSFDFIL